MSDNAWIKKSLESLDKKVDRLDQRLDTMSETLAKQHVQLADHIRRTGLAEESITLLREESKIASEKAAEHLKPIEHHVDRVQFTFKIIRFIGVVVAIGTGVISIAHFLLNVLKMHQ
jgi:hypothetical protein